MWLHGDERKVTEGNRVALGGLALHTAAVHFSVVVLDPLRH
jgi:hypothetical protein